MPAIVHSTIASSRRETMAGIIMWLMGVPLVVILLLYLLF
jgi:hypothetical protein